MKRLGETLRRCWLFWVVLFSHREPAYGWALFRILTGACLLYSLTSVGATGLVDILWVDAAYGGYRSLGPVRVLLLDLGPATPSLINSIYALALIGSAALALGIGGRLVTFLTLQSFLSLTTVNSQSSGSDDALLCNALWLLFLCDASSTLSLRCKIRTGRWASNASVGAWARYLIVFQLLVMYTFAGLNKTNTDWVPWGAMDALYNALMDTTWRRFDMSWIAHVYPLTQLASVVTWVFETFAWVMLLVFYYRYTRDRPGRLRSAFNRWDLRMPFTIVGAVLHLGIFVAMNVGPFSLVSLSYYVCLWRPEELRAVLARYSSMRSTPSVSRMRSLP